MSTPWQLLADECARRADLARPVEFWWRDDDASRRVPALECLLALSEGSRVPLALAVVPQAADETLFDALSDGVSVLQHGCDHVNRATPGEKKSEFPASESIAAALARLAGARRRLLAMAGSRALDVLVPPWNRIYGALLPHVAEAGFHGLSRFGARGALMVAPGVRQMNTHVDLVAWQGDRGFVGVEAALAQAVRCIAESRRHTPRDGDEPLGWLTHHACHDAAAWKFLGRLFDESRRWPGVRWIAASDFFVQRVVA